VVESSFLTIKFVIKNQGVNFIKIFKNLLDFIINISFYVYVSVLHHNMVKLQHYKNIYSYLHSKTSSLLQHYRLLTNKIGGGGRHLGLFQQI